ncbi:VWA domain-containing protein [Emticicia sp. 21SJ11W-3]|uniref:vWA domain-containing protein n=1 Tax=Emticicia sp. 21SJ11W-3 TaxID=2916755 RepID=UPI00209C8B70|nr:VWA domain-containing protein [Emticicia sp. 21SJ11W-3]UTA70308.1 VWA domain-containing protein [Emticicia sp. 21SJ11W-3]
MLLDFFYHLKANHLPVSLREHLTLLEALNKEVIAYNVEDFYFLSRAIFVKHEQNLDLYDKLFGEFFGDLESVPVESLLANMNEDWLKTHLLKELSEADKQGIEAMGGLEQLLERLRDLLNEQKERHEGGSKWVGTGGTSPFGNSGYNPAGIRVGGKGGGKTAVKVWDKRDFKNYDNDLELNTRNTKMALRRLRILTREGVEDELNIEETIERTSQNAGLLDIKMQASRQNRVKVLLLLDVGGSMDDFIEECSTLFSSAKYQFKHLEYFYFHNCIYETMWKDNGRRYEDKIATWDILNKYNKDYKVIFVGDASMSPWELSEPRGSVEHYNEESGLTWLSRFKEKFPNLVWLNPINDGYWQYTHSIKLIRDWSDDRMFPLTINGIEKAMKCLKNNKLKFS